MRRIVSLALPLAFLFLSAMPTLAQERSAEMQALDYWVGEWTGTESGGSSDTQVCKWLGTSFVQCESENSNGSVLWLMGYDATAGAYTTAYFWGNGENGVVDTVTRQGDTMTWLSDIPTGGQYRMAWVLESRDIMTLKSEMAEEGGDWVVQDENTMTRVR
jgi:hypothetical protein